MFVCCRLQRLGVVAIILAVLWSLFTNTTEKYLGGLDWAYPKIFNWHPILMVAGMIICTTEGKRCQQKRYSCGALLIADTLPLLQVCSRFEHSRLIKLSTGVSVTFGIRAALPS